MALPDALDAQLAANRQAIRDTRARLIAYATALWFGLGSWNVPDVDRFVAALLPVVLGAQRTTARLTEQQIALLVARFMLAPPKPVGLDLEALAGAPLRNGADPVEVYRRPARVVWQALAEGVPLDVAVERGAVRLEQLAATDVQLAKTHAARQVMAATPGTYGFRRVLTGESSCGLCALAATQRYHRGDLLPIHPACDCDVAPLLAPSEHVLDPAGVAKVHALAREFFGAKTDAYGASTGSHPEHQPIDFRDFVVVHDHGEYGPVLARRGDHFEGPAN